MKTAKCWIVCEECDDPYYEGHPTGMVFLSEALAKEYVGDDKRLYLEQGYITEEVNHEKS